MASGAKHRCFKGLAGVGAGVAAWRAATFENGGHPAVGAAHRADRRQCFGRQEEARGQGRPAGREAAAPGEQGLLPAQGGQGHVRVSPSPAKAFGTNVFLRSGRATYSKMSLSW